MSSGPLPSRVDFRKLAEDRASVEGEMAIKACPRLCGLLESDTGEFAVALAFAPGEGRKPRVSGSCVGTVSMLCQNCLEPVDIGLDVRIESIIVASIDQLMELDEEEDGVVCEGSMLPIVDIIEDELMVSLPMVPKHPDGACGELWQPASVHDEVAEKAPETHRPFAGLDALKKDLKRSE